MAKAMAVVNEQHLQIRARDGFPLAATLFTMNSPDADATAASSSSNKPHQHHQENHLVIVIGSATGVLRRFYRNFARYCCEHSGGCPVLTFDYRGIGDSTKQQSSSSPQSSCSSLRDIRASISTWARQDFAGIVDFCSNRFPSRQICLVGHSVGGHLPGLTTPDVNRRISRALFVASQNAYWRYFLENTRNSRLRNWANVLVVLGLLPLVTCTFGYAPTKRFGIMEDLPARAMYQWVWFVKHAQYAVDRNGRQFREGFDSTRFPIAALSFTDDDKASEGATKSWHSFFTQTQVHHMRIEPRQIGFTTSIGHMGFFKLPSAEEDRKNHEKMISLLWAPALDFILNGSTSSFPISPTLEGGGGKSITANVMLSRM